MNYRPHQERITLYYKTDPTTKDKIKFEVDTAPFGSFVRCSAHPDFPFPSNIQSTWHGKANSPKAYTYGHCLGYTESGRIILGACVCGGYEYTYRNNTEDPRCVEIEQPDKTFKRVKIHMTKTENRK